MGMKIQTPERYETSLRKLFPRGSYWDRQFADPESDCSLFCRAKLDEFVRFRNRMGDLQDESVIWSASETLDDWERVLTGSITTGLSDEQRRMLLVASKAGNVTVSFIKEIGRMYGTTVTGLRFPFRPAFFGFSRFGIDHIAGPASFSTVFIHASNPESTEKKDAFEEMLKARALANYILCFVYNNPQEGDAQ
jgi:uncharacterized protein YmfQ (DUF2313 family)